MRPVCRICLLAGLVALAGCGNDNGFSDLDAYMNEVRLRPPGKIEPTPTFRPYETFTYSAANLRSPFSRQVRVDQAERQRGSRNVRPDPNRVKQYLEGFNIEQFEMVGTISNVSGSFALLRGAGGCIGSRSVTIWGATTGGSSTSVPPRSMWSKSFPMARVPGWSDHGPFL